MVELDVSSEFLTATLVCIDDSGGSNTLGREYACVDGVLDFDRRSSFSNTQNCSQMYPLFRSVDEVNSHLRSQFKIKE